MPPGPRPLRLDCGPHRYADTQIHIHMLAIIGLGLVRIYILNCSITSSICTAPQAPNIALPIFKQHSLYRHYAKIPKNKIWIISSKCYKWNLVNTQDGYLKVRYENNKTFRTGNSLRRHLE